MIQIEIKIQQPKLRKAAERLVETIEFAPKREFDRFSIGPEIYGSQNVKVNIAFDNKERKFLILKELPPQLWAIASNEWEILKKFEEIRRGQLNAPKAVYRTNSGFYMTLIDGETIRIDEDVERTINKIRKMANQVRTLHRANIIHRDIKPGNVLIDERSEVVLIDFGLALDKEQQDPLKDNIVGTPEYISPEMITKVSEIGFPADIYAVGIIMYELVQRRLPFGCNVWKMEDYFRAHEKTTPNKPNPEHPKAKALANIIMKCIEKDPQKRFNSEELPLAIDEELKKVK